METKVLYLSDIMAKEKGGCLNTVKEDVYLLKYKQLEEMVVSAFEEKKKDIPGLWWTEV